MRPPAQQYEYFIVALTKGNKLVSDVVKGESFSTAYDKFLDIHDLGGNVQEYAFCIKRSKG